MLPLDKGFLDIHFFFEITFFPPAPDSYLIALPVPGEMKKTMLCTLKLQQTLPGPLPLLVETATSFLSLAKDCMLHMPQDLPVAPSDSPRN